mmetsp:Transcript_9630/g.13244  ORF Transcript_9630/g.13244 Transcript_9630/m.13244 type:complete len:170 (-) Transcript_9630:369-878(-)
MTDERALVLILLASARLLCSSFPIVSSSAEPHGVSKGYLHVPKKGESKRWMLPFLSLSTLRGGRGLMERRKPYLGKRGMAKKRRLKLEQEDNEEVRERRRMLPSNIMKKNRAMLRDGPKEASRNPMPSFLMSRKRSKQRGAKTKGKIRLKRYRKRHKKKKPKQVSNHVL